MAALQISDRRERALVTAADAFFAGTAALARPLRHRSRPGDPARILLLRLERIGDLLMTLPALADVRGAAPHADVDLVVGSWNAALAQSISGISRVHVVDAPWLTRENAGATVTSLLKTAGRWRARRYDLAVNLEPDVRSNLLIAISGARWTAGYSSGGGGSLLDQAVEYDPTEHTAENARRLVGEVLRAPRATPARLLAIPETHQREAAALLSGRHRPLIAMHVAGGRPIKQWDPEQFATVARRLVKSRRGTIVLTGGPEDGPLVDRMKLALPGASVVDASRGLSLLTAGAILEGCELLITGDTGPMHLAAAVGTPIVAVFGPSDPRRYAPRGAHDRVIRVDLPCAPCNRIRLPPARCRGHIPDCLALVTPDRVFDAAVAVLDESRARSLNAPA
jgi:ADP-heptose:LPS heptosyltransferase